MAFLRTGLQRNSQVPGGSRMIQLKEGLDSAVARILEAAETLYEAPKVVETLESLEVPQKLGASRVSLTSPAASASSASLTLEKPDDMDPHDFSDSDETQEDDDELLKHWTLQNAEENIQALLNSIRCDERLDALEVLQESCARNAAGSGTLNSEMDQLERDLYRDWQEIDECISKFREDLEEKEKCTYQVLRCYFNSIKQQTGGDKPQGQAKGRGQSRYQVDLRSGNVTQEHQPSDVLEAFHSLYRDMQKHTETLEMESKRQAAYEHAMRKMQRAILFDEDPTRDNVTSQVLKEVRRWGLDAAAEWEPEENDTLSKTEYAMKVAKVKTEIEVLKKKLERYNAQKETRRLSRRTSVTKRNEREGSEEWRSACHANYSLFNESVEKSFQQDIGQLTKAQKKLEGFLHRFEDLKTAVDHAVPDVEDSKQKIFEVLKRARPQLRDIEPLPDVPSAEEKRVAHFTAIRQVYDVEQEREHAENLKRLQNEKEHLEQQTAEQEQKKAQLLKAIRSEEHTHDCLHAEIEDANVVMQGLDDNVNLVLARECMEKVEELKKINVEKERELLAEVAHADAAESLEWKASMVLDQLKAVAHEVLLARHAELLSSESEDSEVEVRRELSHIVERLNFDHAQATNGPKPLDLSSGSSQQSQQRLSISPGNSPRSAGRRASMTVPSSSSFRDEKAQEEVNRSRRKTMTKGAAVLAGIMAIGGMSSSAQADSKGGARRSSMISPSASIRDAPVTEGSFRDVPGAKDPSRDAENQEKVTRARRKTMTRGAQVLASIMAKVGDTADGDPDAYLDARRSSLALPGSSSSFAGVKQDLVTRARRKTLTRGAEALADVRSKLLSETVDDPDADPSPRRSSLALPGSSSFAGVKQDLVTRARRKTVTRGADALADVKSKLLNELVDDPDADPSPRRSSLALPGSSSSSFAGEKQDLVTRARRKTVTRGADALADVKSKLLSETVDDPDADPSPRRSSLALPGSSSSFAGLVTRARRKTLTRGAKAFADIVAKVGEAVGDDPDPDPDIPAMNGA